MTTPDWQNDPEAASVLLEDPILLVGKRRGKRIDVRSINLHRDTFEDLRRIASRASEALDTMQARDYDVAGELEPGEEYFTLDLAEFHAEPALVTLINMVDKTEIEIPDPFTKPTPRDEFFDSFNELGQIDVLDAAQLRGSHFLFYAITFENDDHQIIVFRKQDPTVALKRGFAAFTYGDTLRKVDKPDIVLDEEIDFVIRDRHVYVLRKNAFEMIVSDLRVVLQDVPKIVVELSAALDARIKLHPTALAAITAACSKRISYAVRLRSLPARVASADIDLNKVRESMTLHGEDPDTLLNTADEFEFGEDGVAKFLDVVESRFFEDDFTGEKQRADRLSRRPTT